MSVTLSQSQTRDCIQVDIVNDVISDPNEVFEVVLTTNTVNATVLAGARTAIVTITNNEIGKYMWQLDNWLMPIGVKRTTITNVHCEHNLYIFYHINTWARSGWSTISTCDVL